MRNALIIARSTGHGKTRLIAHGECFAQAVWFVDPVGECNQLDWPHVNNLVWPHRDRAVEFNPLNRRGL